jgi:hypothetical protein
MPLNFVGDTFGRPYQNVGYGDQSPLEVDENLEEY